MKVESLLAEYKNLKYGEEYINVPLPALQEIHSYDLLSEGYNAAPDGKDILKFIQKWPFAKAGGFTDGNFVIETVLGQIPENLSKESLMMFFSDALDLFGWADEKEFNEDGTFRFWFD